MPQIEGNPTEAGKKLCGLAWTLLGKTKGVVRLGEIYRAKCPESGLDRYTNGTWL